METAQIFEIIIYKTGSHKVPFLDWLQKLDKPTRATIKSKLERIESAGNLGDIKHITGGIWELRIHYGPGYRMYCGRQGNKIIVLLLGGNKGSQNRDIAKAQEYWKDYARRNV